MKCKIMVLFNFFKIFYENIIQTGVQGIILQVHGGGN